MMNQLTKTFLFFGVLSLVVVPGRAFALPLIDMPPVDPDDVKINFPLLPPGKKKNTEAFCAGFPMTTDSIKKTLAEKNGTVDEFLKETGNTLSEKRNARDAKLEGARSKADERRSEWYVRLEEKAESDAEKDAVLKFKQTLEGVVDERREKVDAALAEFRTGVDVVVAKRKTSMDSARTNFQKAVDAALAQVAADCAAGDTTASITKEFKSSLKTARETLKADTANMGKVKTEIQALTNTKEAALKQAFAEFDAAVEAAKATLKKSFGE